MNALIYGIQKAQEYKARRRWSRREVNRLLPDYTGRVILITIIVAMIAFVGLILRMEAANADEWQWSYGRNPDITYTTMYVNVSANSHLNGRDKPDVHASIEAKFYCGEAVEVAKIVDDWALVLGGECGHVWCKVEYLSYEEVVQ